MLGRLTKIAAVVLVALVLAGAIGALWLRHTLRASLPALDGEIAVAGLRAPVTIERDGLGIPTIRAADRNDLAFATGFVHAQDRFFQMDLLRRVAAGELAALVGPAAVPADENVRLHRFRTRARRMIESAAPRHLELIHAYTDGVNAGLGSLGGKPVEYVLLRQEPGPWRLEDGTLVLLAMFLDLQDERARADADRGLMRDVLGESLYAFLMPRGTDWDAPLMGEPYGDPPIPGPEVVDLRTMDGWSALRDTEQAARAAPALRETPLAAGSNNWAVDASRSAHGGALVAGDMHLGLDVPNVWYRASLVWPGDDGQQHRLTGVTLPGGPVLVAGSNGHVAWAFTNSYGDWSDLVLIEPDPDDPDRYLTPDGPRDFERVTETIEVAGGAPATLEIVETIWGPLVDRDHLGRQRALRWLAHDTAAVNFGQLGIETLRTVDEALAQANRTGIPAQNFVAVDREGRIGWTLMGIVPQRRGFDGRLPVSWADGSNGWDGWLEPAEYPRILDPPEGRLWTANARVADGDALLKIGDGNYPLGARARQIRDGLRALGKADERDLLSIQLDDRALFLERWRDLLLELLSDEALRDRPERAELRRLVVETWTGRASTDSVGFRLVRGYRLFVSELLFEALLAPCRKIEPEFSYPGRQSEGPLWRLVSERPAHLLHPRFASWEAWLLHAVDYTLDYYLETGPAAVAALGEDGGRLPLSTLSEATWGARNTTRITHPLSRAVPQLGRWLDAPALPLPGDSNMPRVQGPTFGASQRMVVSPGREQDGLFHMPGGQSGHPLSPHYLDQHDAWANGLPTPFLPGPTVHTLTLTPKRGAESAP